MVMEKAKMIDNWTMIISMGNDDSDDNGRHHHHHHHHHQYFHNSLQGTPPPISRYQRGDRKSATSASSGSCKSLGCESQMLGARWNQKKLVKLHVGYQRCCKILATHSCARAENVDWWIWINKSPKNMKLHVANLPHLQVNSFQLPFQQFLKPKYP